jgi:hypothetical protein
MYCTSVGGHLCNNIQCFRCYPTGDWGITHGEWEELTRYEAEEWLKKLRAWDKSGRIGDRPGIAHTEWGLDSKPHRVNEYGEPEPDGCCILQ